MLGIIVQARMNSHRLPGKILKKVGSKSILEHIFYRLTFLINPVKIVLATTINPKDNVVESFCKERKFEFFRGSEDDVLSRYYECARQYNFNHVIRLTGDNPFTDIEELDNLINLHLSSGADYTHSFGILPVGVGAEIFTIKALEKSYQNGKKQNHREHVNEYILENPALFKISVLSVPKVKNRPDVRLTIDTEEDYKKASYIVVNSSNEYVSTEKAIELCLHYV